MTVDQLLQEIASDNRSGAAELLGRSVELFDRLEAERNEFATVSQARRAVLEATLGLLRSQPCMATLINLASRVISAASSAIDSDEVLKHCAKASREFNDACRCAVTAAARHTSTSIADGTTVLTHSRSSTILQGLAAARAMGKNFNVFVTESRPMMEGLKLAEELAGQDMRVTLIADAGVASVMQQVGLVLVGADLITPRTVVNKIGTRLIALAARERSVPIYVVADYSKLINLLPHNLPAEPKREPGELWSDAPSNVMVMNRYFEETPLESFNGIISEEGTQTPEGVSQRAAAAVVNPELVDALLETL